MGRRLQVEHHLSPEELQRLYRSAKDPVARSQLQMVWLATQGKTVEEVAEVTGYCKRRVREVLRGYNLRGPEALGDRRHQNPGSRKPLLNPAQQEALREALSGPAPDGKPWNSTKVARWLEECLGRKVRPQRGWEWQRRLAPTGSRSRRASASMTTNRSQKSG